MGLSRDYSHIIKHCRVFRCKRFTTVESLKTTMETVLTTIKFQQIDVTKLEKRIENLELKIEYYNQRDHTFYKNK